jgi:hypothetical protein
VENFKNCFEALVTLGRLDTKTVESVKDALEFYTENIILGDWSSFSKIGDDSIYKNLIINPGIKFSAERNSKLFYIVNEDYLDLVPALSGVEILDESAIISQLNGDDSVIITKEVHAQLENMLNSSDADNHIVAMEIIANCRYKESLFYILKLMSDFHQKMQNSPTINHVNFKSLLSYLDKTKYNINFSMDDKINKLIEKDVLTPGMLNALIKEEVSKEGHHFYSSTLKVKSITGGEEVLKYLNTNYVFKLTEDFTPEEKIVEEPDNSSAAEEFPNWL